MPAVEELVKMAEIEIDDLRAAYLRGRTRSKMVPYFSVLYLRIEEECESARAVLNSLGLGSRSDYSVFYRFRQCCVRWGVWVSAREFAGLWNRKYFDPAAVSEWRELEGYLEKGMMPVLTGARLSWAETKKGGAGGNAVTRSAGNRRRLRKLSLSSWIEKGYGPTEIFRFLRPFLKGLTWWQVYLQVQEVCRGLESKSLPSGVVSAGIEAIVTEDGGCGGNGAGKRRGRVSEEGSARIAVVDGASVFGAGVCEPETVDVVQVVEQPENGLLKLFGDLPEGGAVDEFLFSAGGAKLRSGAFWRSVAEAAGADFRGNIEFGGLNVGVGPGGLGNLLAWCESFSLALTSALGFENRPYAGALCHYPKYKSFHPWFSVVGHLLRTAWGIDPPGRRAELDSYFAKSRLRIGFPNDGGEAELGSMEEAFCLYLVHSSLVNAVPEFLVMSLAGEWKNGASRIYLGGGANSPWRTLNYSLLFADYARVVFSTGSGDLERRVKRELFKAGVFEPSVA